ncbi:MAG: hypothetical protein KatS3mg038_3765 [Candidatus Kapaibacterium sp.]|nr:MAG: hypothetical protein KatS3mg038_3765 [Candidatus Kapabacteria bacterium]
MKPSVRIRAIALTVAMLPSVAHAQDYITIIRTAIVNGRSISDRAWKAGIEIRPEDYIQWIAAVRTTTGDTIDAASYLTELSRGDVTQQRLQTTPTIEYKGLPEGDYTLRIQAQLAPGNSAAPVLLRFRVGRTLALGDEQSPPPSAPDTTASTEAPAFPIRLWIAVALASSIISLILATLLLQHRRRSRLTAQDFDRLHAELDRAQNRITELEQLRQQQHEQIEHLHQRLAAYQQHAEKNNKHLAEQNRQLRQQVEQLRAAKERLEQLQKEKDELLSRLVHDIKNPLMVIEELVQLLRHYDNNSTQMQQLLNDLAETTSRVLALSQQVSRLLVLEGSDGLAFDVEAVNLTEILRSVIRRNAYLARRKGIEILEDLPESMVAECDPQRIEEAFDNVVSNAIKYSHANSIVLVRAKAGEASHTIEIEDHGVGMSTEDMQRLFERGMQGSAGPTAQEPSSGIGLWIVRRIIDRHNGTIKIRSTQGEGTLVTITLPVTQSQTQPTSDDGTPISENQ